MAYFDSFEIQLMNFHVLLLDFVDDYRVECWNVSVHTVK